MTPSGEMPARLPLTGADCFLRAFDAETRRTGGASHLSQLVLRLGPGFDPTRFERVVERVALACPIVRAPIRRPAFRPPEYRLDLAPRAALPRIAVHHSALPRGRAAFAGDEPIPAVFFERLNAPMALRRGELLRFDVVRHAAPDGADAGTDLAMTWAHMLMDGSGSENVLAHLAAVDAGARAPDALPADEWAPQIAPLPATLRERGERARTWHAHLLSFARARPVSPAGPLRRVPQELRYANDWMDEAESARVFERAKAKAGFLTPMLFYLAAAVRAHAAVLRARGTAVPSWVVPLPVNARPRGSEGAFFRTRVSMLWFQLLPEQIATLDGAIDALKQQRHALIKSGAVENGMAAMDLARHAPMRAYSALARSAFRGELCSFFFAWTGEFAPGVASLCGAPVRNAFHTPSVPASPGSGAILCSRAGRLNAVHVHQRGVFRDDELALYRAALRADLVGAEGDGARASGGGG
ncbi:MAG: hypothetical protein KC560_00185 [Myxococcales bacterium]|nr:hypothetical protein [Myxococcales bacterium]